MNFQSNSFLQDDLIYIVGHRNPDLDSIASAYAYQYYRHAKGDFNYLAVRCDPVNDLTNWIFSYFKQGLPKKIESIAGKRVVLIDHTDAEQRPNGWEKSEIIEVVDHHRLSLETTSPPKITIRPYGSTATIIADKLLQNNIKISSELAGIMFSAIIDDTLGLRSPVTTDIDKMVAREMAAKSEIEDLSIFMKDFFAQKDNWNTMTISEIITADVKELNSNGVHIVVSQVETMSNKGLLEKENEFYEQMNIMEKENPTDLRLLMLTDLLSNSCVVLAAGKKVQDLENIFSTKLIEGKKLFLPGVLSRKKQVLTPILKYYSK